MSIIFGPLVWKVDVGIWDKKTVHDVEYGVS